MSYDRKERNTKISNRLAMSEATDYNQIMCSREVEV